MDRGSGRLESTLRSSLFRSPEHWAVVPIRLGGVVRRPSVSHHQAPEHEPREWDVHTGDGVIRAVSPVPRETWAQVLATDPGATAFHLPQWLDCICSVGGWQDASRLYRTAEGRELVLPDGSAARAGSVRSPCSPPSPRTGERAAFWRPEESAPTKSTWFSPTSPPTEYCAPASILHSPLHARGRGVVRRGSSPCPGRFMYWISTAAWTPCGRSDGPGSHEGGCAPRNARPSRPAWSSKAATRPSWWPPSTTSTCDGSTGARGSGTCPRLLSAAVESVRSRLPNSRR